jgi:transposase
VVGVAGRETGRLYLEVVGHADRQTLERVVEDNTAPGCTVYTDDWGSYAHLPELGRPHAAVCHTPGKREWARDDDGDGIREVHDNTLEGIWTGLRNYLRPFRGVSKHHLAEYVAMFQWAHNLKAATDEFLRVLLGAPTTTRPAT